MLLLAGASPTASAASPAAAAAPVAEMPVHPGQDSAPELCPVRPAYPLPGTLPALREALQQADDAMPHCLRNAAFYAWRGALQLVLGQTQAAAESLERALLLDPDLPGAQLDYAQALSAMGDHLSARELLEQVNLRSDVPDHLRPLLRASLQTLMPVQPDAFVSRWLLSTAWGHDSNLNNAPVAGQLTLTFPQGPVTLPLDSASRPRAGGAWLNSVQWQTAKPMGESVLLLSAEARSRVTASNAQTGYLQTDVSAFWLQAPEAASQWLGRLSWGRLEFGGDNWLTTVRASMQKQWRLPPRGLLRHGCRLGLGAELEDRGYPISPEYNGLYAGGLLSLSCGDSLAGSAPSGWFAQPQYGVQLRWGQDEPRRAGRPGGRNDRRELRMNWEARMQQGRLAADYSWTRQADSTGYSPLFDNNSVRTTYRQGLRLMYSHPLSQPVWGGAEAFIALELTRQQSNLAAFVVRQHSLTSGLRWELK